MEGVRRQGSIESRQLTRDRTHSCSYYLILQELCIIGCPLIPLEVPRQRELRDQNRLVLFFRLCRIECYRVLYRGALFPVYDNILERSESDKWLEKVFSHQLVKDLWFSSYSSYRLSKVPSRWITNQCRRPNHSTWLCSDDQGIWVFILPRL